MGGAVELTCEGHPPGRLDRDATAPVVLDALTSKASVESRDMLSTSNNSKRV
jgi:hypothetical protein